MSKIMFTARENKLKQIPPYLSRFQANKQSNKLMKIKILCFKYLLLEKRKEKREGEIAAAIFFLASTASSLHPSSLVKQSQLMEEDQCLFHT